MKMLQTVVIGLCVIVGVLTKVIPITNICESQDGVLRCSYSGEGQYISLQDLNNIREIRFERFFQPSTLFIENAKQLRQIIIQSGSTQCEDISCDNPKVLISIAGIPCQSSKFTTSSITYTTSEPASSHQTERPITSTTSTPPSTLSLQSVLLVVFASLAIFVGILFTIHFVRKYLQKKSTRPHSTLDQVVISNFINSSNSSIELFNLEKIDSIKKNE
ncbi:uncharacterized protein LOC134718566 isoform X2 [Mytilus trossulus]|uniref:uncharacterized protein LOC134718566 isoform X2 n=1 Tax=Mytilus trossulus TaxID=6551 RepID=UPI00300790F6